MTTWFEYEQAIKDKKLFDLIKSFYLENGYTPKHIQLAKLFGKSRGSINPRLARLKKQKLIQSKSGKIKLPPKIRKELDAKVGDK